MAGQVEAFGEGELPEGLSSQSMRQVYVKLLHEPGTSPALEKRLVQQVLDHAKKIIAHPTRPTKRQLDTWLTNPFGELALEESLEEDPSLESIDNVFVEQWIERPFSCVAMLDCSSSMSGEKHLLASVAVAVLLLEVPLHSSALTTFATRSKVIKAMGTVEPPAATVLRFLQSRPIGFTNIYEGLNAGLKQCRESNQKKKVGVLASDGRSTEGGDPIELAKQFDLLVVLHLHGHGSDLDASEAIAQAGNGICLEVDKFEQLPRRLYDGLRMVVRR